MEIVHPTAGELATAPHFTIVNRMHIQLVAVSVPKWEDWMSKEQDHQFIRNFMMVLVALAVMGIACGVLANIVAGT